VLQAVDGTKIYADVCQSRSVHKKDLEKLRELLLLDLEKGMSEVMEQIEVREKCESDGIQEHKRYKLPQELQDKRKLKELIQNGMDKLSLEKQKELKEGIEETLKELEESETEHVNLTDQEAVMMRTDRKIQFSYNAQCTVDEQEQIIVGAEVSLAASDNQQLIGMIEESEKNTRHRCKETLGDGGYFSGEALQIASEKGYDVLVPLHPEISGRGKVEGKDARFLKGRFEYDEIKDVYRCPEVAGKELVFCGNKTQILKNGARIRSRSYRCIDYKNCNHRWSCCCGNRGRKVERTAYDKEIEVLKAKLCEKSNREKLKRRSKIVEPVFGWIKWCHGFRRWNYRGLRSVRAQWMLMCTVINLKKLIKNWQAGILKWEMEMGT